MCYDPSSGELLVSDTLAGAPIYRFDSDFGTYLGMTSLDIVDGSPAATLRGFAVGCAPNGNVYRSYIDNASRPIWKSDDRLSTTAHNVMISEPANFTRNMEISGSGENTYIATIGEGDYGPALILKAKNAECTEFERWRVITGENLIPPGAGKSGIGISPVKDSEPPEWVFGADVVGGIMALRVFHYEEGDYVFKDEQNSVNGLFWRLNNRR